MLQPSARRLATATFVLAVAACSSASPHPAATRPSQPASSRTSTSASTASPTSVTTNAATTTIAATTTTVTTTAPATAAPATTAPAAFSGTVTAVSAAEIASTYRAGCPVGPASLRMLHMSYWGFDNEPHIGTMVVNAAVAQPVLTVFATLFRDRFPIRRMVPVDVYGGSDPASMAADNTSGFNCRYVQDTNPPQWSVHAYGEAIDINPVENPYLVAGTVQPAAGRAFLDRGVSRPGMTGTGTAVNAAFAAIGWPWGGRFHSPDYQHFSKTGG